MCCGRATRIKNCSLYRHVPILATAVPVKYYRIKLPVRFEKNFWQFKIREPTYSVNITKQTHVQIIVYGILEIGTKNSLILRNFLKIWCLKFIHKVQSSDQKSLDSGFSKNQDLDPDLDFLVWIGLILH